MQSLSDDERKAILELARQGVVEAACHARPVHPIPHEGVFARRCGVFVTLHVRGRLRGCIGVIEAREPLGESLVRCAGGAAVEDPRFPSMRPDEASEVQIEVSLLSELRRIKPEEIEIGKHGLVVERGARRGLLLPQVAVEHHLGREEFLRETCLKAGLPADAWSDPATNVLGFTCEIVGQAD